MSDPCTQGSTISIIHDTLKRMDRAMEEDRKDRKETEKQLFNILQTLADNTARINHLEEHSESNAQQNTLLFERVRDLELNYAHADGPAARQRLTDAIDSLVERVDGVGEKVDVGFRKLDKLNRFYNLTTHKYALVVYAAVFALIVVGTGLDLVYHKETIMAIYHFFKG